MSAAVAVAACRRASEDAPAPPPSPSATAAPLASPAVAGTAALVDTVRAKVELARGRRVTLSGMGLEQIPVSVLAVLGTLEELDLSHNLLDELPEEIADVPGLVALDLSQNRVARLPERMPALRYLNVQGNPLAEPPSIGTLETLYVDRITDVAHFLAMTNLQAVGVDWRLVHKDDRYHEISLAHAWRTSTFVAADVPGKVAGDREAKRPFLARAASPVRLASDERPGEGACSGLSLGTMRGLDERELRARVTAACVPLWAWSDEGPVPVPLSGVRIAPTPTDGCDEARREFELSVATRAEGWLLASDGTPPRRPAVPAAKMARVTKGMTLTTSFALPPGFAWTGTEWFVHPEGPAHFAVVSARGFGGDEMPLVRTEWRGLFLVKGKDAVRLAESDPFGGCAGPHLFELGGMIDFGGDGDLDLVLLGDDPMLLERVEGGFRTHAPMQVPCRC